MITLISPAKTLKTDIPAIENSNLPILISNSKKLVSLLKKQKPNQLSELMGISAKLAQLNYERYQQWKYPFPENLMLNAIFAFKGEVYSGIDIDSFTAEQLEYCQNHLRILSGLYGLLKPMDTILPYRLEMGTKLKIGEMKNLYAFWGDKISNLLNKELKYSKETTIINLASNEYFKSINTNIINADIVTPIFKENKSGNYKVISIFAKKARGLMTRFIMHNRIEKVEDLKCFDLEGYFFNTKLSSNHELVFTR
jgi:hypothetical protein